MNRSVCRVRGPAARIFLQNLLTLNMDKVTPAAAQAGALLTPQGKILFDLFAFQDGEDILLETGVNYITAFMQRLQFYKLRADVHIAPAPDLFVYASWPAAPPGVNAFADPRCAALGWRVYTGEPLPTNAAAEDYHHHRRLCGVAEAGLDYTLGDTFPEEANFDREDSVDFQKGCYVGQEVVSRMHHRGTGRKRILRFSMQGSAEPGEPVQAGEKTIGIMGSAARGIGLALVRTDHVQHAIAAGTALTAGTATLTLLESCQAIEGTRHAAHQA